MNELMRQIDEEKTAVARQAPPFLKFVAVNWLAVSLFLAIFFAQEPAILVPSVICAGIVVCLQYQPLRKCPGPVTRAVVLYLSMVLFLFLDGLVLSWVLPLGNSESVPWLERLDHGLRFALIGQFFGAIGYPGVVFLNHLLDWPPPTVNSFAKTSR